MASNINPLIDFNLPKCYAPMEIPSADEGGVLASFFQAKAELPDEVTVLDPIMPTDYPDSLKNQVYVAPDGNDMADGSEAHPFRTPTKALEALRGKEGGVLWFKGGTYTLKKPLTVTEEFSGTDRSPLFLAACPNEEVCLSGGIDIDRTAFGPVTDAAALARLAPEAAAHILVVDLAALGIAPSDIKPYTGAVKPALFLDGCQQILARYPNDRELVMGEVVKIGKCVSAHSAMFGKDPTPGWEIRLTDDRALGWSAENDIWYNGAVYAEWEKRPYLVTIDKAARTIKSPVSNTYGARWVEDNTYYFYNVLEELDAEGEFYIDTRNGKLYVYDNGFEKATLVIMDEPLVVVDKAANVIVDGLTVTGTIGTGMTIRDGLQDVIQHCRVHHCGLNGASVKGVRCGALYSVFSANGSVQCTLSGNDRAPLIPDNNFIQNCTLQPSDSQTGTSTGGVGYVVSHNLYDCTVAFVSGSNEAVFEYNDFNHGSLTTADSGMIYVNGHDLSSRGNHIRYNNFHNVKASHAGVYIDDCASGQYVYGNIVDVDLNDAESNAFSGKMTYRLHNGRECVFWNNISINATHSAFSDNANYYKPESIRWAPMRETVLNCGREQMESPVFVARYPIYADYYRKVCQHAEDIKAEGYTRNALEERLRSPEHNVYQNNVIVNAAVPFCISEPGLKTAVGIDKNYVCEQSPLDERYQLTGDEARAVLTDWEDVPFEKMGLCRR